MKIALLSIVIALLVGWVAIALIATLSLLKAASKSSPKDPDQQDSFNENECASSNSRTLKDYQNSRDWD